MANIGQTIIIRTDIFELPQDMGLLAAQVAHIHFEHTRQMLKDNLDDAGKAVITIEKQADAIDQLINKTYYEGWIEEPYIYVKKVPNFEALEYFKQEAERANLPVHEWRDTVYVRLSPTIKKAFPDTMVGISIGPADSDKIRAVVGDLPLL